jgi:putative ABC transport system ATP-binding protein
VATETPAPPPAAAAPAAAPRRRTGKLDLTQRPAVGEPLVVCEDVSRTYHVGGEDVFAVRDVSCVIPAGRLVALRGRSGSGKTTLLNIISGLDKPTRGRASVLGHETTRMHDRELTELRRHFIGFIFQTFALLPVLSAFENVELPLRIAGAGARERTRRTTELLELVGLGSRMHHRPFELSGGEQERVAIARALANEPGLIVADEPTGELDSVTGLQIMMLFRRIVQERGVTIIMATHDPTISEIADETLIMSDGRMSRDIPEELQGTGILDAANLPGTLHGEITSAASRGGLSTRTDRDASAGSQSGRSSQAAQAAQAAQAGQSRQAGGAGDAGDEAESGAPLPPPDDRDEDVQLPPMPTRSVRVEDEPAPRDPRA